MSLKNLSLATDVEEDKDVLGGFKVLDTGLYFARINRAYIVKSNGGATGVVFNFDLGDAGEYQETLWVTNKEGQNTYQGKDGKKHSLPGFVTFYNITALAIEKMPADLDTEEKCLNIYNFETGKKEPSYVDTLPELEDAEIQLGIVQAKEYRNRKVDGSYLITDQVISTNSISKVFDTDGLTYAERKAQQEEPKFIEEWKGRFNQEYVNDKTKGVTPQITIEGLNENQEEKPSKKDTKKPSKTLFSKKEEK